MATNEIVGYCEGCGKAIYMNESRASHKGRMWHFFCRPSEGRNVPVSDVKGVATVGVNVMGTSENYYVPTLEAFEALQAQVQNLTLHCETIEGHGYDLKAQLLSTGMANVLSNSDRIEDLSNRLAALETVDKAQAQYLPSALHVVKAQRSYEEVLVELRAVRQQLATANETPERVELNCGCKVDYDLVGFKQLEKSAALVPQLRDNISKLLEERETLRLENERLNSALVELHEKKNEAQNAAGKYRREAEGLTEKIGKYDFSGFLLLERDADLGALVRRMPAFTSLMQYDKGVWTVFLQDEVRSYSDDMPEAALKAALKTKEATP